MGVPDLQGVWSHGTATPLERPDRYEGREFLTEEEIAEANLNATTFATAERRSELSPERDVRLAYNQFWWDRGLSDGRTALIVDPPDGKIPPQTPEAEERTTARRAAARPRELSENPEDRNLWERCLTRGAVRLGGAYNNNLQIFQTEHHVAIFLEMVHETRIIPLRDSQPDSSPRRWLGSSRGHWEGDTLVVETVNFSGQAPWRGSGENLRLVERFSRPDADTLLYEVTFEDPTTWTRDWTAAGHAQDERAGLRVRLSRRELRHGEPADRRAGPGAGSRRDVEIGRPRSYSRSVRTEAPAIPRIAAARDRSVHRFRRLTPRSRPAIDNLTADDVDTCGDVAVTHWPGSTALRSLLSLDRHPERHVSTGGA